MRSHSNLLLTRFGLVNCVLVWTNLALLWLSLVVCLIEFGLVWLGYSTDKQTNNNYLILINLICEFVFGYSTDKQKKINNYSILIIICEFVC